MKPILLLTTFLCTLTATLACKTQNSDSAEKGLFQDPTFEAIGKIVESPIMSFETQIKANISQTKAESKVYYRTYSASRRKTLPRVRTCVLQHGYGGTPDLIAFLKKNETTFDSFVSGYFGMSAISNLLAGPCEFVLVTLHESHDSDILSSIERTETFVRNIACKPGDSRGSNALSCAIVGHSKGGAIVSNMARRCMQQTSLLGKDGCAEIGEFYSETGIVRGTSLAFLIYGAKISNNRSLLNSLTLVTAGGVRQFSELLWSVDGDFIPGKTNPMWLDVSPFARVENGVPVSVANLIPLNKEGWLVGDIASSVTMNGFKGNFYSDLLGCGTFQGDYINRAICRFYQISTASVHQDDLKKIFDLGLAAIKADSRFYYNGSSSYLDHITWLTYQSGDGLADFEGAISGCFQYGTAVKKCTRLQNLNHWVTAGAAKEAIDDVVKELSN